MYWTVILLICLFGIMLVKYHISRIPQYKTAIKLPGPTALPVIGNALEFLCKNEELLSRFIYQVEKYPKPMRFWMGQKLLLVFSAPDDIEQILSSSKMNYKDDLYRFMKPFLGNGLISGSGKKQFKTIIKVVRRYFVYVFFGHFCCLPYFLRLYSFVYTYLFLFLLRCFTTKTMLSHSIYLFRYISISLLMYSSLVI